MVGRRWVSKKITDLSHKQEGINSGEEEEEKGGGGREGWGIGM